MTRAPTRVEVETAEAGQLLVRWEPAGGHGVDIGCGPTPDPTTHDHVTRVSAGEGSVRLTDVPAAGRPYVSISHREGVLVAAERRVRFDGVPNFRDLGGYPTATGGRTRWGSLFRSGALHALTTTDLKIFDHLEVHAIFDLRRDDERVREPGPRPSRSLPVPLRFEEPPDLSPLRERADGQRWLFNDYRVMLEAGAPVYGALLSGLAEASGTVVFHCAGGKDRTGLAAALLLTWLGVDRDTVLDDYELTTRYWMQLDLEPIVEGMVALGIARPAAAGLLDAPRWVLAETLNRLDVEHGGIEAYLRGPAGMSSSALDGLRRRFVV